LIQEGRHSHVEKSHFPETKNESIPSGQSRTKAASIGPKVVDTEQSLDLNQSKLVSYQEISDVSNARNPHQSSSTSQSRLENPFLLNYSNRVTTFKDQQVAAVIKIQVSLKILPIVSCNL